MRRWSKPSCGRAGSTELVYSLIEPVAPDNSSGVSTAASTASFQTRNSSEMPEQLQRFLRTYSTLHGDLEPVGSCAVTTAAISIIRTRRIRGRSASLSATTWRARTCEPGTELTSDYRTICDAMRSAAWNSAIPISTVGRARH